MWPTPERGRFADILPLLREYHAYAGAGMVGDVWIAREAGRVVAGWIWIPPTPSAALRYSAFAPAVLSLSRMVAIPKAERDWQISKPLRWIMLHGIDRGRWPVLLTYSDHGAGHLGTAYQASRWKRGATEERPVFVDASGARRAPYTDGGRKANVTRVGTTTMTAWTHRVCPYGQEEAHMRAHGWRRVLAGGTYRSGSPAYTWTNEPEQPSLFGSLP